MPDDSSNRPIRGASELLFVTPGKLGDSLISLIIAHNLVRAGYSVTVRSNMAHELAEWLPSFVTGPAVAHREYAALVRDYDLCIIDSQAPNLQRNGIDLRPELAARAAFFSLAHYETPLDGMFKPETLPQDKKQRLEKLIPQRGLIRDRLNPQASMVEHAVAFCRREMHLADASAEIGIEVPRSVRTRPRVPSRVVISPTSGKEKKNWRPQRFLALASRLSKRGADCVFAVEPSEQAAWNKKLNGRFVLAETHSVADLAALLAGAAVVVSNDSGTAHLASAIGVPVVCIISSWDTSYGWRPGWAGSELIGPILPVRSLPGLWPFFVSVSRVANAVRQKLETARSATDS